MATAATRGAWRVLVVDDEQNLNWSLVNSLRKEGYISDGALTGVEAQRLLRESQYDCVISDVKMPGMDGFELLQWVREYQPRARVIMMTAFGSPTARDEALRGGVLAYLEKPFDLRTLKDELRRLAANGPPGQGEGEAYDLLEVARVINLSRRDIAMTVRSNGHTGRLRFVRGELVWAGVETMYGDEAFLALCTPRATYMQPLAWDGPAERNVSLPISRLLHLALARREGRATFGTRPLPPLSSVAPAEPASAPTPAAPASAPTLAAPVNTSGTSGPAPSAPDAIAASPPAGMGSQTLPGSGPLMPPPENGALVAALAALGSDLPAPNIAALMKTDGSVLAHTERQTKGLPAGAYAHLSAATQAAARALLVADLGILDDVRVTTSEHLLLVRRIARAERTALLLLVLPTGVDYDAVVAAIRTHTAALLDAPR